MHYICDAGSRAYWKVTLIGLFAVVAAALLIGSLAAPAQAQAYAQAPEGLQAADVSGQLATQSSARDAQLSTQASIDKTAASDAKAIIKKAKASAGTAAEKLKRIYSYIAKDKSFKGVYQIETLPFFKMKYGSTYYSYLTREVIENKLLSKYYKKYAVDMFNDKKGTCFHYAALFGVTAKQALGDTATVKIAAGASMHTGEKNPYHAWVEVKLGKKTYVYDTQAGNSLSKSKGKATAFGKFCGTEKGKLKANYCNYKDVQYTVVK